MWDNSFIRMKRWLTGVGEKGTIDLNIRLPSDEKLHLNASENLSLKTCLYYISCHPILEIDGLIYIYINGDTCSSSYFNSQLKNSNFGPNMYIHITKDNSDIYKTMTKNFVMKKYTHEFIIDNNTYVPSSHAFHTQLKGNIMIY